MNVKEQQYLVVRLEISNVSSIDGKELWKLKDNLLGIRTEFVPKTEAKVVLGLCSVLDSTSGLAFPIVFPFDVIVRVTFDPGA